LLVIFIALLVGPLVAGKRLKGVPDAPMDLGQPSGLVNNDTFSSETGTAVQQPATDDSSGTQTSSDSAATNAVRMLKYYI